MTPSAVGTLGDTPLAHGLVYARNRRLTGLFELHAPPAAEGDPDRKAVISLLHGRIIAVDTTPLGLCPGGFFGAIVYELGFIESAMLDVTLLEIAKTRRLHGEVLIERGAITRAQRDEGLVEQIHRKVHHLFSFPDSTRYAFYDTKPTREAAVAVDAVGPVWRGVREFPPTRFVDETMRRVGESELRATGGGGALLPPTEAALLQRLAHQPMTLAQMKASASELSPARVELLVYLLVIAKCVEATNGTRTHPSTGSLPANMPSGPMPRVSATMQTPYKSPLPMAAARSPRPPPARISSTKIPAQRGAAPAPGTLAALRTPAELGHQGIVARAESIRDESLFDVLGVSDGASEEAVRAAYMRLAKTWHPDRLVSDFDPVRGEIATIFTFMTRAHQTLTDAEARRAYLASHSAKKAARPREVVLREIRHGIEHRHFDAAVERCQELIDADHDDAEALALQAWAGCRGGEAPEEELRTALAKVERAVNTDRTNDAAVYHRGLIHKRLGNGPVAIRDFARALQLNPKNLNAEREIRIFSMRVKKGSGEHKLIAPILDKIEKK